MATLVVEIPETLKTELDQRHVPPALVDALIVQTIETWLRINAKRNGQAEDKRLSPFAGSALPFIEQLMDDNLELFERLAKL